MSCIMEFESSNDAIISMVADKNDGTPTSSTLDTPVAEVCSSERIPVCAASLKPVIGMTFFELKHGISFYKEYADNSGFKIRLATQKMNRGIVQTKYCLCNKAGSSQPKGTQKIGKKTRTDCNAKVIFTRSKEGHYVITKFYEGHSHLLATPNTMIHLTQSRELNLFHKRMILDNSRLNQGPVKSFRMFKEHVKGYKNVGASLEDFKNFSRDVKKFIKGYDAQMLIENFMQKKAICNCFFFDFDVDDEGRLSKIFWADPISIKNYTLFGDMISFDTTFNMNAYRMVFAPFTGVDHHKKCVTFGAGLLANETTESFSWLFECFLKAMGDKYPICIVTDQDLGIKGAVEKVFSTKTQHRFCMWHIMKKVAEKVGPIICRETNFLKDLSSCVWAEDVEPSEFESQWHSIISLYELNDNDWLK